MSRKKYLGIDNSSLGCGTHGRGYILQTSARLKETDGKSPLRLGMDLKVESCW